MYREMFNVSWTVESYSTIREYQLFYRKSKLPKTYHHHNQHDDNKLDYVDGTYDRQHFEHYYNQQQQQQHDNEKWKNIIMSENFFGIKEFENDFTDNLQHFQNGKFSLTTLSV